MTRATSRWAVALVALACGGCGHELVRVSVEPPPVEATAPVRLPATIRCTYANRSELRAPELLELVERLQRAAGGERTIEAYGDGPIEAVLRVSRASMPKVFTEPRNALSVFSWLVVPFPFAFIWTEREPDMVLDVALEVGVRGEPPAGRYVASARGTLSAQTPPPYVYEEHHITNPHAAQLIGLGLDAVVSRFAADREAHARIAADLDEAAPRELEALLVTTETHAPRARWRTKKLLELRARTLSTRLAEAPAAELRDLIVRLEACLLDLTNAAELSRDAAERAVAEGKAAEAEEPRALSLAYRERLEVLKAILDAVRAEVDARGR